MADFYCDISAIGNEYQAYAAAMTWGGASTDKPLPMDGNGKAGPGHSAAVAVGVIDCTGASATAGIIGVFGASVTGCTGSASALASDIVTRINGSTTATTSTFCAALLGLQYVVFARVDPADANKVQVATRCAGADWNGLANGITQSDFTVAPTITLFSGGADGPFAYVVAETSVFSRAALTHGAWFATALGIATPGNNDVIHYRTARSGSDLTVTLTTGANTSRTWSGCNHLYDNGSLWTGDDGTLTVYFSFSTYQFSGTLPTTKTLIHQSRGDRNLDIKWKTSAYIAFVNEPSNSGTPTIYLSRVGIIEDSSVASGSFVVARSSNGYASPLNLSVIDCFIQTYSSAKTLIASIGYISNSNHRICLNGTEFYVVAATGPIGAIVSDNATPLYVEWIGGSIKDSNGAYSCASPFTLLTTGDNVRAYVNNVDGVTDFSIAFTSDRSSSELVFDNTGVASKRYRHITPSFTIDWAGDGTFPHCGAQSVAGDYWSHRISWNSRTWYSRPSTPIKFATFYRGSTGQRTLTLELLTPDSYAFKLHEFAVMVVYADSTGAIRRETLAGTGASLLGISSHSEAALSSSSKSWTLNGVTGYSTKKLELTTAHQVLTNTEITLVLMLNNTLAAGYAFYLSPDLGIT